ADVVLSLDADFLAEGPMARRWSRDFAARRRLAEPTGDPGRLYVVEPMPTPTGSLADHRLARRAGAVPALALGLLAELRALGRPVPALPVLPALADADRRWLRAVAADLAAHAGRSLVIVGERQPPACHALGHWLNAALGGPV